jgi:hypothetical protein
VREAIDESCRSQHLEEGRALPCTPTDLQTHSALIPPADSGRPPLASPMPVRHIAFVLLSIGIVILLLQFIQLFKRKLVEIVGTLSQKKRRSQYWKTLPTKSNSFWSFNSSPAGAWPS